MSSELVRVMVNDTWYEVEVDEISQTPFEVRVNGNPYLVQVEMTSGAVPQVDTPASTTLLPQAAPSQVVQTSPPSRTGTTSSSGSAMEIRAPMPGVILDIQVQPGNPVKAGQTICYLEAMKMKNAIRTPRDGTITAVLVTDGQKVSYNDCIVRFS